MADEPSEEANEAIQAWLQHPMTVHSAKGFATEAQNALTNLIGAARKTTDPKVAAFVAQYDVLIRAKKTMSGEE